MYHQPSPLDQIDQSQISDSPGQTPQKGMAVEVNLTSGLIVRIGGRVRGVGLKIEGLGYRVEGAGFRF